MRSVTGVTLERIYRTADAMLRRAIGEHADNLAFFASIGATASFLTEKCALERFWTAELQYRMEGRIFTPTFPAT